VSVPEVGELMDCLVRDAPSPRPVQRADPAALAPTP